MLRLRDKWVWDFWLHPGSDRWHLWFLQADRALKDEGLRHWNVSHGHATSVDLVHWTQEGTCFAPAESPAWDDKTVWTGSVIRAGVGGTDGRGLWHLFYTGTCTAEDGRRQRIGHATSVDGHAWQRVGNGLVLDLRVEDPVSTHYEEHLDGPWDGRAMRDPWVMPDPSGAGWLMYFTARTNQGDALNARGAIGMARSDDLHHWTLLPPVYAGGDFGQLEVPQVFAHGGRWYCIFCTAAEHWSATYRERAEQGGFGTPVTGTHYLMAESPLGPWHVAEGPFLDGAFPCRRYAGKVVQTGSGLALMAFDYWGTDQQFLGTIGAPIPVQCDALTGLLRLQP